MNKNLLIICLLFIMVTINATVVEESKIFDIAKYFMETKTSQSLSLRDYEILKDNNAENIIYKIDYEPEGFVIISADDISVPILGFSEKGTIIDCSLKAINDMINGYKSEIIAIKEAGCSNINTKLKWDELDNKLLTRERIIVEIDMESTWSQIGFYDNYCPSFSGNRSAVGCVSTALSQIINYHKVWNYNFSNSDDYYSEISIGGQTYTVNIDNDYSTHDFPSFNQLNILMNSVSEQYSFDNSLSNDQKSALSFANGILTEMNYSPSGSGTSTYNDAYRAYNELSYNRNRASKSSYTDLEWEQMIIGNINNGLPIQYRGSGTNGGHSFIITGYEIESGTQFLINWGWGGLYEGQYYSLSHLNPGSYDFTDSQKMIYDIEPKATIDLIVDLSNTGFSGFSIMKFEDTQGNVQTFNSNSNGVFNIETDPGLYNIYISHNSENYEWVTLYGKNIYKGSNQIFGGEVTLNYNPDKILRIPEDYNEIQTAIDKIQDGGCVIVSEGNYNVDLLSWRQKHIILVSLLNSPATLTSNTHAILLDWEGINNNDAIRGFIFQNCYNQINGPAITLLNGASPKIEHCEFSNNSIDTDYELQYTEAEGLGGAVLVVGKQNQSQIPNFNYCLFDNNFGYGVNGGGAVALLGGAKFYDCTFSNNFTSLYVSIDYPDNLYSGGAFLVYNTVCNNDIIFDKCTFTNNSSQENSADIFVITTGALENFEITNCNFINSENNYGGESIAFFEETDNYQEYNIGTTITMENNKFENQSSCVFFNDHGGRNSFNFSNNLILDANNYGLLVKYFNTSSSNQNNFTFNNNTLINMAGYGLRIIRGTNYIVSNNIFSDCFCAIKLGTNSQNNPESLNVNNCLFYNNSDDFIASGGAEEIFTLSNIYYGNPLLDNNYQPIWNTTTKSPCIDTGDLSEAWDVDETPSDIGAVRAIDHDYWGTSATVNRVRYCCFPVLDRRNNSGFDTEEVCKVAETQTNKFTVKYANNVLKEWKNNLWTGELNFLDSTQGYKITTLNSFNIPTSGITLPENTEITLLEGEENWVGYFVKESMSMQDALEDVWEHVISVYGEDWGWDNSNTYPSTRCSFIYGKMYIIKVDEDCTFTYTEGVPQTPKEREMTEGFSFTETSEYTPINIVSIDDPNVLEIGLLIDGVCKGAAKVEEFPVQLLAFVGDTTRGEISFEFYYGDRNYKCTNEFTVLNNQLGNSETSRLEFKPYQSQTIRLGNVNETPKEFSLSNNYPNPFNPTTTINYSIPTDTNVEISIYNVKGQKVITLVDETKSAGQYAAIWSGTDNNGNKVSSGIYFYKIVAGEKAEIKKMIMIK